MKFTIEGTALARHMGPLEATVLQHEGIDYDYASMAIKEYDGRKYLDSKVCQPSYVSMMHLNLSGLKSEDGEDMVGSGPIDADAEVSEGGTSARMKFSDLKKACRIVGANCGSFYVDKDKKFIVKVGNTLLYEDAEVLDYGLDITLPVEDVKDRRAFNEFAPDGSVDSARMCSALEAAIRVGSVTGQKGELRSRAIHLNIEGANMNVEVITHNSILIYPVECNLSGKSDNILSLPLHIAISTDASRALMKACARSCQNMYWMYDVDGVDKEDEQICFSSFVYTMRINTEKVDDCSIPALDKNNAVTLNVKKIELLSAVYRVKVAGYKNLVLRWNDRKYITVGSPDRNVESTFEMTAAGGPDQKVSITLPTDNLINILAAFNPKQESFRLMYDFMNCFLEVREDGDDIRGMVFIV